MANMYSCNKCKKTFPVKPYVAKTLMQYDKDAFCPFCGSDQHTNKVGMIRKKRRVAGSLADPISAGQISYIKSLGGNPDSVKTKGDAGAYIAALKKRAGKQ